MILVEVYVPVLDETYDFQMDENVETGILIEEAAEAICQKEQRPLKGRVEELTLWKEDSQFRIPQEKTLRECQILSGSRLLLV